MKLGICKEEVTALDVFNRTVDVYFEEDRSKTFGEGPPKRCFEFVRKGSPIFYLVSLINSQNDQTIFELITLLNLAWSFLLFEQCKPVE